MEIDEEIYLQHFGVLGMKWGVHLDDGSRRKNKRGTAIALGAAFVTSMYRSPLSINPRRSVVTNVAIGGVTATVVKGFLNARQDRRLAEIRSQRP